MTPPNRNIHAAIEAHQGRIVVILKEAGIARPGNQIFGKKAQRPTKLREIATQVVSMVQQPMWRGPWIE